MVATGATGALQTIDDADKVRRHINPTYLHENGTISTSAYQTRNMSLDLCRLRTLNESIASRPGWGMTEFEARVPRDIGLQVVHAPIKDDAQEPDNPAHCEVPGKATNSQAKKLRDAAIETHRPSG